MEQFFGVILLSIVVEGVVTYVKTWFVDKHFQWQQLVTCILGIVIALAYAMDILSLFGVTSKVPYVGQILTGILLSRGSNYIFDFIKRITKVTTGTDLISEVEDEEGLG